MLARRRFCPALEKHDALSAVAKSGTRNIHCYIAHSDYGYGLSNGVAAWPCQIANSEVHVCQGFSFDIERRGTPYTGTDENSGISVTEQVVNHKIAAHRNARSNTDPQLQHTTLIPF